MSSDSAAILEHADAHETSIFLLAYLAFASSLITWLMIGFWYFTRESGLLWFGLGAGIVFGASMYGLFRRMMEDGACRVASKVRAFSLVGSAVLYFSLLLLHACVFANRIVFFIGISVAFAGVLLRQWAVVVKKTVQAHAEKQGKPLPIVEVGPYAFFLHPRYIGTALILLGCAITIQPFRLVIFLTMLPLALHWIAAKQEEAMFAANPGLGSRYAEYRARVKQSRAVLLARMLGRRQKSRAASTQFKTQTKWIEHIDKQTLLQSAVPAVGFFLLLLVLGYYIGIGTTKFSFFGHANL
jgi:protein-S-isoprenylcysteine O-methyltransferase Ste14